MNKNTSAIDTNLYPKVVSSLMKNMGKYNAMISRFMAIRADAMYDTFPSSRIPYGTRDVMDLYDAFLMVSDSIENDIKYSQEINEEFNSEFLEQVVDFLQCRCDVLNMVNERERNWNRKRNLEV